MTTVEWEKDFYGIKVNVTTREDDCVIYRIKDTLGDAVLTRYEVYPGISLIYNDVHTSHISIGKMVNNPNILEINHCREGRIEFESASGEYIYVKKGDMAINTKAGVKEYSNFPQSHYHGVTIELDIDEIKKNHPLLMDNLNLNVENMKNTFCKENRCYVLHQKQEFEHIFEELYCVPEKIRKQYYQLKVHEILLFLSAVDVEHEHIENRYFNKDLVAVIKEVKGYMMDHLEQRITIEFISDKFKISSTNLKKCFHEVYGNSIYAYLKELRIHKAAQLLQNDNYDIGTIAGMVGYDNASKFASSFKSIMGINPREYRKSV